MGFRANYASVAAVRRSIMQRKSSQVESNGDEDHSGDAQLGGLLTQCATQNIFGLPPAEWLALDDIAALRAWADRGATTPAMLFGRLLHSTPTLGASDVPSMPNPTRRALLDTIVPALTHEPDFPRRPTWNGTPVETGCAFANAGDATGRADALDVRQQRPDPHDRTARRARRSSWTISPPPTWRRARRPTKARPWTIDRHRASKAWR